MFCSSVWEGAAVKLSGLKTRSKSCVLLHRLRTKSCRPCLASGGVSSAVATHKADVGHPRQEGEGETCARCIRACADCVMGSLCPGTGHRSGSGLEPQQAPGCSPEPESSLAAGPQAELIAMKSLMGSNEGI